MPLSGPDARLHTNETCPAHGRYRSSCRCHVAIPMAESETAPTCPLCGHAVDWFPENGTTGRGLVVNPPARMPRTA